MDRLMCLEYQHRNRYREQDERTPTLLTTYDIEWYANVGRRNAHDYRALF